MLPLLFDEMHGGKSEEFRKLGCEAVSVRELRETRFWMQHDHVISYAEKNGMVLIAEDRESFGGCMENQIPCVQLGQNPTNYEIIKELEKFKNLP